MDGGGYIVGAAMVDSRWSCRIIEYRRVPHGVVSGQRWISDLCWAETAPGASLEPNDAWPNEV